MALHFGPGKGPGHLNKLLQGATAAATDAPVNNGAPALVGIQTVGQTLTASNGVWTQSPTNYAYQWQKNASNILGATTQAYVLQAADAGAAITCIVTASNRFGSASATTNSVTTAGALTISSTPSTPPTTGTGGGAYSVTFAGAGGHTAYVFSATGLGSSGLTINASTGVLSATTLGAVATYGPITVTVTDHDGLTASATPFSIVVSAGSSLVAFPSNRNYAAFGDSTAEQTIGQNGAGAAANIFSAFGYNPKQSTSGVGGGLGLFSNGKFRLGRHPNYGQSGCTAVQAMANPRLNNSNTASPGLWYKGLELDFSGGPSGVSNKSIATFNADGVGAAVLCLGHNATQAALAVTPTLGAEAAAFGAHVADFDASKLIIIVTPWPRGVKPDGSAGQATTAAYSAAMKDFCAWLLKFDYASGDALAMPNVLVVDAWNAIWSGSGDGAATAYTNKTGYLIDGLHLTGLGGRTVTDLITARLTAAYGSTYTGAASLCVLPTSDGFTHVLDAQPYININPQFLQSTGGNYNGNTWASAPTAANAIPRDFLMNNAGCSGMTLAVAWEDSGSTWHGTVSGALAATTASFGFAKSYNAAAVTALLTSGQMAVTDKLRAYARINITSGSAAKLTAVNLSITAQRTSVTTGQIGPAVDLGAIPISPDGQWIDLETPLLDFLEPGMDAANATGGGQGTGGPGCYYNGTSLDLSTLAFTLGFSFAGAIGNTVGLDVRISDMGLRRAPD